MTEEFLEREVHFYRQALMEACAHATESGFWEQQVPGVFARFQALSRMDVPQFRQVCARLLEDDQREVRLGTIKLLHSMTIRDDMLWQDAVDVILVFHVKIDRTRGSNTMVVNDWFFEEVLCRRCSPRKID